MEKEVRFRIGSKYPDLLKYQGLTPQEFAGKKRFDGLSDQDKEIVRQRARRAIMSACEMEVPQGDVRIPSSQVAGEKYENNAKKRRYQSPQFSAIKS